MSTNLRAQRDESVNEVQKLTLEVLDLRKQRDEMLAAAKAAVAHFDHYYPANSGFWDTKQGQEILEWLNPLTRAIAKAEGRK